MSELAKEKLYRKELIKAGGEGKNNIERIRSLGNGGGTSTKTLVTAHPKQTIKNKYWVSKTWSGGRTTMKGDRVWTDGKNIYYSDNQYQFVLDKTTSTWVEKNDWNLTSFNGLYIWTDGENIYHTKDSTTYVYDKKISNWDTIRKTWNGYNIVDGSRVWTDGTNIYYSYGSGEGTQLVLNKETSTWERMTNWEVTGFNGNEMWTDGINIYRSNGTTHSVLDKTTMNWEGKTWNYEGGSEFSYGANQIWTDGEDIYYCNANADYWVLDKATSTWVKKHDSSFGNITGVGVWTDGEHIYHFYYSGMYEEYIIEEGLPVHS